MTRFKKLDEEKRTALRDGVQAREKMAELERETVLLRSLNQKLREEKETLMMEVSV